MQWIEFTNTRAVVYHTDECEKNNIMSWCFAQLIYERKTKCKIVFNSTILTHNSCAQVQESMYRITYVPVQQLFC